MQTFLPYESFVESARCLDRQRLGKQRIEAKQIFNALTEPGHGWRNHPAVKMWEGYEAMLLTYGMAICVEWIGRGYNDNQLAWFSERVDGVTVPADTPWWLGHEPFHSSHRSNLIRKDKDWYGKYGWTEGPDLPYFWPTHRTIREAVRRARGGDAPPLQQRTFA